MPTIIEAVDEILSNLHGSDADKLSNAKYVINKILDVTKQEKHIIDRSSVRKITLYSSYWSKMKEEIEKRY